MSNHATHNLLKGAGLALWQELDETYGFGPHERQLAAELCQTITLIEQMAKRIDVEGMTVRVSAATGSTHYLPRSASSGAVAARLTAALGIPATKGP